MFYDKDINEVLSYLNVSTKEDILVSQCCEQQLEIQKTHEIQEHEKTDLEETPVLTGKCHIMLKVMVFK